MKSFCWVVLLLSVNILFCTRLKAQEPAIFFSDLTSGPSSGGENSAGALVTLYGNYFSDNPSVTIGGAKAQIKANPSSYLWYQKMTFQVPASVGNGVTNINVVTSQGTSNSVQFTVRNARILFVATNGNDSNSGSFDSPWKTITKAREKWTAGDIVYVRSGVSQTSNDGNGWRASFSLFPNFQGWAAGTPDAPIALVAYPGEQVVVGGGADFGIRIGDGMQYLTIAGLILRGGSIAVQVGGDGYRFVGNNISSPNTHSQAGCWSSNFAEDVKFLGNDVHDCGTGDSDKQDHAVYFSTDVNHVDMGWNADHDNQACYGVQFHSSPIGTGNGFNQYDLKVHDNRFYNQTCAAINFATIDPSQGAIEFYNNLVYHVGYRAAIEGGETACMYIPGFTNAGSPGNGTVSVYSNTFYDCGPAAFAVFDKDHKVRLTNNAILVKPGSSYFTTDTNMNSISGSNNFWFGNGSGPVQTLSSGKLLRRPIQPTKKNVVVRAKSRVIAAGSS